MMYYFGAFLLSAPVGKVHPVLGIQSSICNCFLNQENQVKNNMHLDNWVVIVWLVQTQLWGVQRIRVAWGALKHH